MKKRILSSILFSLLAATSIQAANAPSSIVGKKLTFNVTDHSDGDPFVAIFYVTSTNYYWEVGDGGSGWDSGY